jgi:hypothetical protein
MENFSEKPKKSVLVFSTRSYPTFGRSRKPFDEQNPPNTVTDSPYYWWFMFLRFNTDYKATCEANGVGKCADLYKDFGDVYGVNFKQWWTDKAYLFAEPKKGYKMKVATDINEIAPFNDDTVLNLVVPLTWSQRSLKKAFSQLVLKHVEKGKRGVSVEASEAPYRLSGKWNAKALAHAYKVYAIKHAPNDGKKLVWADIGIRAELPYAKEENAIEGRVKDDTVDIRATLTVLAHRHYLRALTFIDSAITKSFPYGVAKKDRITKNNKDL